MTATQATALVADDEPLLRDALVAQLARAWPALRIVAVARNGREAASLFRAHRPTVCFLDIQMPGMTGVQVAQEIGTQAHIVFVTAYDHYAVQAFAEGALDYLVKPVEAARLAGTVARLQSRLATERPVHDIAEQLRQLTLRLAQPAPAASAYLRWISAQTGQHLQLIPVEAIDYLRSDAKYTRVAWHDDSGKAHEAVVGASLKELTSQLDPAGFVQVHRAVLVNLRAISHLVRGDNDTAQIYLRGRAETLPVSRSHLHLFRAM